PEVQPFAFSKNIALGQKALVNCGTVGGDGPFKFRWVQDGRELQMTSSKYAKTVSETFATLVIEAVGAEDVGNYTCTVSNAVGEDSFTAPLTVRDVPRIQPFNFPRHEQMPKKVIVHCAVLEGSEPFRFTWLKDGVTLVSSRKLQVKVLSEALSSLTILDVGAEDIGNYTCTVSNTAGSDKFTSELLVPKIQPFSFPTNPALGKDVAVSCFVTEGQQPLTFQWFKNDRRIHTNAKLSTELVAVKMTTLTVHKISAEDIGNYTCRVSNAAGSDVFTSELFVTGAYTRLQTTVLRKLVWPLWVGRRFIGAPPFVLPRHEQMPKKVIVHCAVLEGSEPFKFTWLKDGTTLTNSRRLQVMVSDAMSSLIIADLNAEDIGNYTCVVTNAAGSDSFTSQLLVTEPPRVQQFSFPKNPTLTTKVVVSCVATGDEPLSFAWSKEGRLLTTGHRISVSILTANIASLTISQVTAEDIGNYTCAASNEAGKDSFTSPLVINGQLLNSPDLTSPFNFPNQEQIPKKVVVHCVVLEGNEPFKFTWLKDGVTLTSNRRLQIKVSEAVSSLAISEVSAEDIGNYTCVVRNAAGSD
ncbi:unnamed protein product, partial [Ixodes hexagonus]